jgi:hypothetical protein
MAARNEKWGNSVVMAKARPVNKRRVKLKKLFEGLYNRYNHRNLIKPDPLQFVYQYNSPSDKEIVAFLSAALAYGRVEQIEKSLTNLFTRMGKSPSAFVQGFDKAKRERLNNFKHRFTTGEDIADLLVLLKKVLSRYGSIEKFFIQGYNPNALCRGDPPSFLSRAGSRDRPKPPLLSSLPPRLSTRVDAAGNRKMWGRSGEIYSNDKNIIPALAKFCDSLWKIYAKEHNGQISSGLKFLLAGPAGGSACKRLNLFLRWMVRKDDVDPGLWESVDKAKLIVPVDVHIGRLCRILGMYTRRTISLASAVEITESFATVEPADPVKFDFALSRIGITEGCNGKYDLRCKYCELAEFCRN